MGNIRRNDFKMAAMNLHYEKLTAKQVNVTLLHSISSRAQLVKSKLDLLYRNQCIIVSTVNEKS
jgi:hypothetical protein